MKTIFLPVLAVILTSCSTELIKSGENKVDINNYIVRLNRDGLIVSPNATKVSWFQSYSNPIPLSKKDAETHINNIFVQAENLAEQKAQYDDSDPSNKKKIVKLLVHVHGGLNLLSDADKRAQETAPKIVSDSNDWAYPVFFSWPSSFQGTYAEHLIYVREGRKTIWPLGLLSSPFVFIADFAQSLGKYPLDVYYQMVNAKDIVAYPKDNNEDNWVPASWGWVSYAWKRAKTEYCNRSTGNNCTPNPNFQTKEGLWLNWSKYYSDQSIKKLTLSGATSPFRYTVGTLGQSSIAISAWKNMKRRTSNIFFPPSQFDDRDSPDAIFDRNMEFRNSQGQLDKGLPGGEFFKLLFSRIDNSKDKYTYQVTVVGHSMGAIVLNNALKKYKNDWSRTGVLKNIVYMAAACSIDDVVDSVFPLLKKINTAVPPVNQVKFYNLMLNRVAEVSETNLGGAAPTGSLLVYIDQHLEIPDHPFDRTFGSEVNVLSSLTALNDELEEQGVGDHMQFKSFHSFPNYIPNKHGDFNDTPFWRQSFWEVGTKTQQPNTNVSTDFNAYPKDWK